MVAGLHLVGLNDRQWYSLAQDHLSWGRLCTEVSLPSAPSVVVGSAASSGSFV